MNRAKTQSIYTDTEIHDWPILDSICTYNTITTAKIKNIFLLLLDASMFTFFQITTKTWNFSEIHRWYKLQQTKSRYYSCEHSPKRGAFILLPVLGCNREEKNKQKPPKQKFAGGFPKRSITYPESFYNEKQVFGGTWYQRATGLIRWEPNSPGSRLSTVVRQRGISYLLWVSRWQTWNKGEE